MILASGPSLGTILVGAGVIASGAVMLSRYLASQAASDPALCKLPPTDRAQRTSEFRALFSSVDIARDRTPEGVQWSLTARPGTEAESLRLAALEERCCDGIKISIRRDGDAVVWNITGPPEANRLLDAFYELPAHIASDAGAAQLWSTLDAAACGPTKP